MGRLLTLGFYSIIAVHGLGANPDWAWVGKKQDDEGNEVHVNWLSDTNMLPSELPGTRIMTFNYESQWFLGNLKQRRSLCAVQLLHSLINQREEVRPPAPSAIMTFILTI
jgi:hypothetical protein